MRIDFSNHHVHVRLFNLITIELGWFDEEWCLLSLDAFKLWENPGFNDTFGFTIIRVQVLRLVFSILVSGGVYA